MEASDLRRLRDLEEENRRLKQMYAELSLEHQLLKDVLDPKQILQTLRRGKAALPRAPVAQHQVAHPRNIP